ncbi:UNVERIFIED_CONTAM: Retrovirus-related Pol polyprotein from transposon [Sesamum calycinum]|uniref:Retrovirus-related Pol polyprotein from transposon n=1 Tax=Sesamum calycinum TaxID=2727403 RepID=A0AAW2QWU6_9LAMI
MFADVNIHGKPISAMIDVGATHNYLASAEVERLGLVLVKGVGQVKAINSAAQPFVGVAKSVLIKMGHFECKTNLPIVVRVKEGDEAKATVVTRYGAFKFLFMPFGLTNASTTFSTMMNQVLHGFLDDFVVVYLDDIVIYSRTLVEHMEHLQQVLTRLCEHELYAKETWSWTPQCQVVFDDLKTTMVTDPVLALPDMSKPFMVETDASDFALGGVLMQDGHAVVFERRKLKFEQRYSLHEKELLVVVHCLRLWQHYLLGSPFVVKMNNTAVSHFMTQPKLTSRQAHWVDLAILGSVAALSSSVVATSIRDEHASYYRKIQQRRAGSTSSSREWKQNVDIARNCLEKAQKRMKKYADHNRRFVEFNAGDLVMVKVLDPRLSKSSRGRDPRLLKKYVGPLLSSSVLEW